MSAADIEQPGALVRALAFGGKVRVLAVVLHGPAREVVRRHELRPGSAVLAAEGVVGAILMSATIKGDERINVQVQSESPRFALSTDVRADGDFRARFTPPNIQRTRKFTGYQQVIKSLYGKELYRSVAEVKDEHFGQALQRFFSQSAQADGRIRIYAELDKKTDEIVFAAGLLVERFPDFPADQFAALFDEPMKADFKTIMAQFAFGQLAGEPVEVLESRPVRFRCHCSHQRVEDMLLTLGTAELVDMLAEQGQAEVTCHFCRETYQFDGPALQALIDRSSAGIAEA